MRLSISRDQWNSKGVHQIKGNRTTVKNSIINQVLSDRVKATARITDTTLPAIITNNPMAETCSNLVTEEISKATMGRTMAGNPAVKIQETTTKDKITSGPKALHKITKDTNKDRRVVNTMIINLNNQTKVKQDRNSTNKTHLLCYRITEVFKKWQVTR
jgi:hypothetical protein